MAENLNLALQITVVGMGLVFAAIIVLWGLMALIVRLTADRADAGDAELPASSEVGDTAAAERESERESERERELKRRAAAVAVSLALAAQQQASQAQPGKFPLPSRAQVSAWQAVTRANQINRRGPRRR